MSIADTDTEGPDRAGRHALPAYSILRPQIGLCPALFASPHSGREYPQWFCDKLRVPLLDLRQTEDAFVDQLFSSAPTHGAQLIKATYARSYVDLNRDARELDPAMFIGAPPGPVAAPTVRIEAGLGCFPRIGARGESIYAKKLSTAEGRARLDHVYTPYHAALSREIAALRQTFGCAILIDCHSMPSRQPGRPDLPDFVLGDRFGSSCTGQLTSLVERFLRAAGFSVTRNAPYAGGYTTRKYGRPKRDVHALQIEINRRLYLNEATVAPIDAMEALTDQLSALVETIAEFSERLRP
mgnify:CR=1 FL=1